MKVDCVARLLASRPSSTEAENKARGAQGLACAIGRFSRDTRGDVAILFGLMALALFMMIGLAVDYGRFISARNQTIAATDAAVLAAARTLQTNGGDQTAALKVAQTYYNQAIQNRIAVMSDTINFAVTDNATSVITTGNASVKTPFMGLGGTNSLPILHTNGADYSKATLAVGGNSETNIEIGLMLDITGSMAGQKLTDMKSAATNLVNIVVWDDQSKYTSRVAIVPFAYDVRIPSTALALARGSGLASSETVSGTKYYLSDCVVERTGTQKYTDAAPASDQYVMAHYTTTTTGSGSSKKGVCDVPAAAEALPMTSNKTTLTSKISGLTTAGSTAGHIGTAWAWYMLSPNWSSLWSSSSTPAAYGTTGVKKIAILMTDGEYNTQYTIQRYPRQFVLPHVLSECREWRLLERPGGFTVHGHEGQGHRGLYHRLPARQSDRRRHTVELRYGCIALLQFRDRRRAESRLQRHRAEDLDALPFTIGEASFEDDRLGTLARASLFRCRRAQEKKRSGVADALLVESRFDEADEGLQCFGPLRPLGGNVKLGTRAGRKHHQAHDRGPSDRVPVARDRNCRVIGFRALDEFCRGARVQTLEVADDDDGFRLQTVE